MPSEKAERSSMSHLFLKMISLSLYAAILIAVVILLRALLKKAPKWSLCLFWALVAIRLLCPVTIESPFSLLPSTEKLSSDDYSVVEHQESEVVIPKTGLTEAVVTEAKNSSRQGKTAIAGVIGDSHEAEYFTGAKPALEKTTEEVDFTQIFAIIWLIGFCVMMGKTIFTFLRLKHSVAASIEVNENVRICDEIRYPFILGIIRPVIYLPSFLEDDVKEFVLAHERAHLNRLDYWWKPLGFILLAIHWFNPLCWIAYILFCRDMEMACDERVIRGMDRNGKADYSQTLLLLSSSSNRITACPVSFGEIGVKERVKGILTYKKPAVWTVLFAFLGCIVMAACFLTSPLRADTAVAQDKVAKVEGDVAYKSDIDGNGQVDYIYMNRLTENKRTDDHMIDWTLVLNGKQIASGSHALICDFDALSVDLDRDGEGEILVKLKPHVNDMPLEEYFVLKQKGGKWVKLQNSSELGAKDELSNAFPVSVKIGKSPATLDIQVEGAEKITVDIRKHYEDMLKDSDVTDFHALAEGVLKSGKYSAGDVFGTVADWGIWKINAASIDGVSCLCATEGIESIEGGKRDILGTMNIYFNYGPDGKINILNTKFMQGNTMYE